MNRFHQWYCQSNHWREKLASEILPWCLDGVELQGEVLELGPGPGLATDWLIRRYSHITCLEKDVHAASALGKRLAETGATVKVGDASKMPFSDGHFSVVFAFTMLHHVPSSPLQDCVFREAFRVLKPGGLFAGTDSLGSFWMWLFHLGDTMVTLDPEELPARLVAAGFKDVKTQTSRGRFRFFARRPECASSAADSTGETLIRTDAPRL